VHQSAFDAVFFFLQWQLFSPSFAFRVLSFLTFREAISNYI
jgi:hypothetical protein